MKVNRCTKYLKQNILPHCLENRIPLRRSFENPAAHWSTENFSHEPPRGLFAPFYAVHQRNPCESSWKRQIPQKPNSRPQDNLHGLKSRETSETYCWDSVPCISRHRRLRPLAEIVWVVTPRHARSICMHLLTTVPPHGCSTRPLSILEFYLVYIPITESRILASRVQKARTDSPPIVPFSISGLDLWLQPSKACYPRL